jgi:1-acyl-sn-glycerol-3-phosphate acyltransferase
MRTDAAESSEKSSVKEVPGASAEGTSAYLWLRTIFRWILAAGFFFSVCPVLILLAIFVDPQKNDEPQRWLSRTLMRLAGVRVEVRRSPGFDPHSVCFFVSNHVNLFDPFVLYCATPQIIRGLELESHFRVPVYGWLMKRFGNVPVPDVNRPSDLKRMWRLTQAALERGVSLAVFPEGSRTITGRVGPFHNGVFRMAQDFGTPITPVSIVGSYTFHRKTSWILRRSTIVVWLHDTIDTSRYGKAEVPELRERVWREVAGPIQASMGEAPAGGSEHPEEAKA